MISFARKLALLSALVFGVWLMASVTSAQQPDRVDVLILLNQPPDQADRTLVEAAGGRIKFSYHLVNAIAASLPARAVDALSNNPRIALIEPDGIATINDAELDNTWGVKAIGADVAHGADPANLGAGIKVAVIDTGIAYTHPDLAANYKGGWDFVNNDSNPMDDNGHGTHVAGTIAALKNATGVVGVAPGAHLYAVKVLNAQGSGSYSVIIAGVQWATDNGMQVTNNSYGGSTGSATLEQAFKNAAAAGVVSIASAGNSGTCAGTSDSVGYPGNYSSVIAVAAIDINNARACFSSTGPAVGLAAPGVNIKSTVKSGGYEDGWNGTSMAAPHVSGAAALVLNRTGGVVDQNANGEIGDEVRNILALSAVDLGNAGRDTWFGFGRVNVPGALSQAVSSGLGISSVTYTPGTGPSKKDLSVTLAAVYKPIVAQAGAVVSATITVNNAFFRSVSGTTDADGEVTFTIKNAPAGTYRTSVTNANATGLQWDLATPANSYVKR